LKCGLGYLLLIDVIGLFIPKLYRSWFGEDPYAVEEMVDEPEVEMTMIPFGPSLAVGAAVAMLFSSEIEAAVRAYLSLTTGN
jgi:leader peptidase (prepilin peptidase)/N-methyltransferase